MVFVVLSFSVVSYPELLLLFLSSAAIQPKCHFSYWFSYPLPQSVTEFAVSVTPPDLTKQTIYSSLSFVSSATMTRIRKRKKEILTVRFHFSFFSKTILKGIFGTISYFKIVLELKKFDQLDFAGNVKAV